MCAFFCEGQTLLIPGARLLENMVLLAAFVLTSWPNLAFHLPCMKRVLAYVHCPTYSCHPLLCSLVCLWRVRAKNVKNHLRLSQAQMIGCLKSCSLYLKQLVSDWFADHQEHFLIGNLDRRCFGTAFSPIEIFGPSLRLV